MGRIKTSLIKRNTKALYSKYGSEFSADFVQNKLQTNKYAEVPSKKLRNVIAGYMTRLKRKEA